MNAARSEDKRGSGLPMSETTMDAVQPAAVAAICLRAKGDGRPTRAYRSPALPRKRNWTVVTSQVLHSEPDGIIGGRTPVRIALLETVAWAKQEADCKWSANERTRSGRLPTSRTTDAASRFANPRCSLGARAMQAECKDGTRRGVNLGRSMARTMDFVQPDTCGWSKENT